MVFTGALLSLAGRAAGEALVARGLRIPVFDSADRLVRRLTADSAVGPLTSPRINHVQIQFFSTDSGREQALLTCPWAAYDRAAETLFGDEVLELSEVRGRISGVGFECLLEQGLLTLRSQVKLSTAAFRAVGDRAKIHFNPKGEEAAVIEEAVLTGGIVVERVPSAKAPYDRAETSYVRYNAAEQKVFLKSPVIVWRNGEKAVVEADSGFLEIDLLESPERSSEGHTPRSSQLER